MTQKLTTMCRILDLEPARVPGNPPPWFIHRTVGSLLEDPEFTGKIHIQDLPSGVRCTPVQLIKQNHDDVIESLQSGRIAYIDLHVFQRDNPTIYASVGETKKHLEGTQGVELVEAFAISDAWISNFSKDCVSSIARNGDVDFGVCKTSLSAVNLSDRCFLAARYSQLSRQHLSLHPGQG